MCVCVCVSVCCTHLPLMELVLRLAPLLLQTFLHFFGDLPSQLWLIHCSEERTKEKANSEHKGMTAVNKSDFELCGRGYGRTREDKKTRRSRPGAPPTRRRADERAAIKTSLHFPRTRAPQSIPTSCASALLRTYVWWKRLRRNTIKMCNCKGYLLTFKMCRLTS